MRCATRTLLALASALLVVAGGLAAQQAGSAQALLRAATDKAAVDGDLNGAITQYQTIVDTFTTDRAVVATALVRMAECYQKLGDAESRKIYERVVREFADLAESAALARTRLAAMDPGVPTINRTAMAVRQIWAGTGADGMRVDGMGALSPDGQSLTFVDWGTGDLAVRNIATGKNRHVTSKGSWSDSGEYSEWSIVSPDGKQVAYAWAHAHDTAKHYDLRLISLDPIDGAKPRVLLDNDDVPYMQPHAWSPDGKQLLAVLARADSTKQIAWLSIADGSIRVLKSLEWRWPDNVSLSPDGRYLAYDVPIRQDSPDRDIVVLAVDGSRETPLVQRPSIDHMPIWAPDGRRILFASDRSGTIGVWTIRVENGRPEGHPELLKPDSGQIRPLGFARDGSLYYSVEAGAQDVFTVELDPETGRIATTPARATDRFVGKNLSPAWSPDGQSLAYVSLRGARFTGAMAVVIRSLTTGEERDFSPKLELDERNPGVRWFPDGRSLVVPAVDNKNQWSLYRMDAHTGEVSLIRRAVSTAEAPVPALSPDGMTLYYNGHDQATGVSSIVAYELQTGTVKDIYRSAPHEWSRKLALSKDGRQLAFVQVQRPDGVPILQTMPVSGGDVRELLRGEKHTPLGLAEGGIEWTPDGRHLLIFRHQSDNAPGPKDALLRVPVTGGDPQVLLEGRGAFPSLHPDGRRIAFTMGTRNAPQVWVMQNFLPIELPSR
jgi:Tol biopolymer transport system component